MIKSLYNHIRESLYDTCYIWREETKMLIHDEGVLLFCLLLPLVYPLLYSWVYNNEVVREVPTAVVDQANSSHSREFIRLCDASPDVAITHRANSIDEARRLIEQQQVRGFYVIPADFEHSLNRREPAYISVYTDMSIMLYYKAIFQTATNVSLEMNKSVQIAMLGNQTDREDVIATQPLDYEDVPIFNPTGGYGNFILPGVLILIIQQTLLLGIGLAAGTQRESNNYSNLVPLSRHYGGPFRIVFGKGLCYLMVYAVQAAYLTMVVPRLFHFVSLAHPLDLLAVMTPYLLACIAFGMVVSCIVRYRENVLLLIVFTSVPLLFLSGAVSWPQSNMPGAWQGISWLFPSTFGVRAFIRLNSMGATFSDVVPEFLCLWLQVGVYFLLACLVYRHQIQMSRQNVHEQLMKMKRKRAVRQRIRAMHPAAH